MANVRMFYGNYEFEPVPIFSESIEMVRDAKQDQNFLRTTREFTGTLLGFPAAQGDFPELFALKEQLRFALGSGNQEFIITSEGIPVVSGEFPRINGPVFAEGTWANRIDYTFSMELDEPVGSKAVQQFNESWSFDEAEDNVSVSVQHDVSAVGVNTQPSGTNNAFNNARAFVLSRAGFSSAVAGAPFFAQVSGISFSAYEELRSEQHDLQQGSFNISERFILSSGNYTHTQNAQFSSDNNGVITINVNGSVRGLGRKPLNVGFARALSAFRNKIRPTLPSTASGVYVDFGGDAVLFTSNPSSQNITQNKFAGTIDYGISYTDSPADNLPSGVLDFSINVQEQDAVRLFASFPIMERNLGPVIHDIGTSNEGTYTIQGNAVGKPGYPINDLLVFVEDQINIRRPQVIDYQTLRVGSKTITKDDRNNTVQFNISWVFTKELSQAFSDGSAPVVID